MFVVDRKIRLEMEELMKILVTGFDSFGDEKVNPSIESEKLPDEIAGAKIIKLEIPAVCHRSLKVIDEAIKEHDLDIYYVNVPIKAMVSKIQEHLYVIMLLMV